jgi:serine protease inhibitor
MSALLLRLRFAAVSFALLACQRAHPFHEVLAKPAAGEAPTLGGTSAVERSNSAAFELWQAIEPRGNHVLSPYSIRAALGLVYLDLQSGPARSNMQSRLHYPARNEDLDARVLHGLVRAADQINFGSVSALWVDRQHVPSRTYLDVVSRSLNAEVHAIDFASEPTRAGRTIALWGSEHTRGAIPNIDVTRPVLIDLTYVSWRSPSNDLAFTGPFSTSPSTTVEAQVSLCAPCVGFLGDDYQVGVAAYPGTSLKLVAIMPKHWSEFHWNKDTYRRVQESMAALRVAELTLPKLRFRSRENLSAVMKKLAVDLRDSRPLGVGALIHESSVDINETSLPFDPSPHLSEQLFGKRLYLRFDRPFYFLLIEPKTDLILLMGQVTDPTK